MNRSHTYNPIFLIAAMAIMVPFQNCSGGFKAKHSSSNSGSVAEKSCGARYAPGLAPLRLLSQPEYNNIVQDLLFTTKVATDVGIFEDTLQGPTGFFSDTSAVQITGLLAEKYWTAAGILADDVIASKGASGGAFAKIAPCATGATVPTSCYASVLRSLGLKAFRRPLIESGASNEYSRLMALMTAQGSFDEGLRAVIQALLINPNFLFVSITSASSAVAGAEFKLDAYQLASRLSLFLWQTIPDKALFEAARTGAILGDAGLNSEIERMLRDPKSDRLIQTLMADWALIRDLETVNRAGLTASLKEAMIKEVQLMFSSLKTEDASLHQIIAGRSSYLNRELANHYGVPFSGSDPNAFVKTSLASVPRRGIFGTGLFLAITAHKDDHPSPVSRGKAIANQFSCFEVPPPPPDVMPDADAVAALPPNPTPYESLAAHRKNPSCAACHNAIDPYGLGLETFDVTGKWRTTYDHLGGKPIYQAGVLPGGGGFASTGDMMNLLAQSPVIRNCSVRKVISIALARKLHSADDQCVAGAIADEAVTEASSFSGLIKSIAKSRLFQMQTGEGQ